MGPLSSGHPTWNEQIFVSPMASNWLPETKMNDNIPARKAAVKMLVNGSVTMAEIAPLAEVTRQAVRPHPCQAAKS
jgi:hypothetical protein